MNGEKLERLQNSLIEEGRTWDCGIKDIPAPLSAITPPSSPSPTMRAASLLPSGSSPENIPPEDSSSSESAGMLLNMMESGSSGKADISNSVISGSISQLPAPVFLSEDASSSEKIVKMDSMRVALVDIVEHNAAAMLIPEPPDEEEEKWLLHTSHPSPTSTVQPYPYPYPYTVEKAMDEIMEVNDKAIERERIRRMKKGMIEEGYYTGTNYFSIHYNHHHSCHHSFTQI